MGTCAATSPGGVTIFRGSALMSRACAGWSFGSDQHSLAFRIEVECVPWEFTDFLQCFARSLIGRLGTQAIGQVSIDESLNDRRIRRHAFGI